MVDINQLDGISEQDKVMLSDIEHMMGQESKSLGFIKQLFWGKLDFTSLDPYPTVSSEEQARCDLLLAKLKAYLKDEHPAIQIDQEEMIPDSCIKRLFDLGVMGMTIPKEFGGLGLGITSYNRVLSLIGSYCGSTAVVVSAHQSIGCKAIMLFGTSLQKETWLNRLAKNTLSAFCLSEPQVGCDASGQETTYHLSEDGKHYIINGEKKWATSGAIAGFLTIVAKHRDDPKVFSAFIGTPDMKGLTITEKNRSKCGIRGTWQARFKFKNMKVPVDHLISAEGQGLKIALTCLNYGRCTLSAGILGAAHRCSLQATKWADTRFQFNRPLADFELVKDKIARMSAYQVAMESMLYMTTGLLDHKIKDIMLETAACKVFCSELGFSIINEAMQVMGGDGYMTVHEVERAFRDNRIHLIVEGSNDVMYPFIFGYGSKPLISFLLELKTLFVWNKTDTLIHYLFRCFCYLFNPKLIFKAFYILLSYLLPFSITFPRLKMKVRPELGVYKTELKYLSRQFYFHALKTIFKYKEQLIVKQLVQKHLSTAVIWIYAYSCLVSKLQTDSVFFDQKKCSAFHFFNLARLKIMDSFRQIHDPIEASLSVAADSQLSHVRGLDETDFYIHESSPTAKGRGKKRKQHFIKSFLTHFKGSQTATQPHEK